MDTAPRDDAQSAGPPVGVLAQGFPRFLLRVTLAHMATYVLAGLCAMTFLDYAALWQTPEFAHYRPLDSPWIAAGPALQVVRGLIFALALWPFHAVFLDQPRGALSLWGLLVGLGILSIYGAGPGSVEGLIYTTIPLRSHLWGLPEVLVQSGAFAFGLVGWYRRPHRAWGVVFGLVTAFAGLASLAGMLLDPR